MRKLLKSGGVPFVLFLAAALATAKTGIAAADAHPSEDQGSIVVVYKDGRLKTIKVDEISRVDFKTPVTIVFKDGHQQSIPSAELARIEFESASTDSTPGTKHFIGKWQVGEGNGSTFYITLEAGGQAKKSIGPSHGTWTVLNGEARISWDDGWHDKIRKVGAKHEKLAYEPGKTFDDKPSNVTAARNTQTQPI